MSERRSRCAAEGRPRWRGELDGSGSSLALAAGSAVLVPGHADALPPGAPKIGMVCTPGTVAGSDPHVQPGRQHRLHRDARRQQHLHVELRQPRRARTTATSSTPGPVLCVDAGGDGRRQPHEHAARAGLDRLPGPGQRVTATGGSAGLLTTEAAASGGTVSYSFTAGQPGHLPVRERLRHREAGRDGPLRRARRPPEPTTCPVVASTDCAYGATPASTRRASTCCCSARSTPILHHAVETGGDVRLQRRRTTATSRSTGASSPTPSRTTAPRCCPNQPYGALVRIQPNTRGQHAAGADPDDQRGRAQPPVPPARQPHDARSPRTAGSVGTLDRALRRDHRLRPDRGLPAPLGRRRTTWNPTHATRCRSPSRTTAT